jgi:hypothetical protein
MQSLKIIVIGLGVLIVFGVCLLGYGLIQKTKNPSWQMLSQNHGVKKTSPYSKFPTFNLNLPKDCKITGISPGKEKIFLSIGGAPKCDRVILVDTKQGLILGTIKARP